VFTNFSKTDPLVSGQRSVVLPFVSSLSASENAASGLNVEPLITSTDVAVARKSGFVLEPKQLKDVVGSEKVTGPHHVAMHVTGEKCSSFFAGRPRPERPVPEKKKDDPNAPPQPKKPSEKPQLDAGSVNLVVIGSNFGFENISPSRLLHDFNLGKVAQEKVSGLGAAIPYYIRYVNAWGRFIGMQNPIHLGDRGRLTGQLAGQQTEFWQKSLNFIFGVFDWATGDVGLSAIRAKSDMDRPLVVTGGTSTQAVKWGLIVALPVIFVTLGFFWTVWFRRSRRSQWAVAAEKSA
jgi:hypothetical protein